MKTIILALLAITATLGITACQQNDIWGETANALSSFATYSSSCPSSCSSASAGSSTSGGTSSVGVSSSGGTSSGWASSLGGSSSSVSTGPVTVIQASVVPKNNSTVRPVITASIPYTGDIYTSSASITVTGSAVGAAVTIPAGDIYGNGTSVLSFTLPVACQAYTPADAGGLKAVTIKITGITDQGGAAVANYSFTYSLERAWKEVFTTGVSFTASDAPLVRMVARDDTLYIAYNTDSYLVLKKYSIPTSNFATDVTIPGTGTPPFDLTCDDSGAYLAYMNGTKLNFKHSTDAYTYSDIELGLVAVPTSLQIAHDNNTNIFVVPNFTSSATLSVFMGETGSNPSFASMPFSTNSSLVDPHTWPTLAVNESGRPYLFLSHGNSPFSQILHDVIIGSAIHYSNLFNPTKMLRMVFVGAVPYVLGKGPTGDTLYVKNLNDTAAYPIVLPHQDFMVESLGDAASDGGTAFFLYSTGTDANKMDMRCAQLNAGDTITLLVDSIGIFADLAGSNVHLGCRPAIAVTTDAIFVAWYNSTDTKLIVRRFNRHP